jgi:glucose-1-phosphate adenylyltransferase
MNDRLVILAGGISSRMKKSVKYDSQLSKQLIEDAESKPKSMIRLGDEGRPFMDYLLMNVKLAEYRDTVIVINEKDSSIKEYYSQFRNKKYFEELQISFAFQKIPEGRDKPLGTADALFQALIMKPDWSGKIFTMCNSDNLYSSKALKMIQASEYLNALIDYDREYLGVEPERVEKFAITKKDEEGFLIDIIEKPSPKEVEYSRTQSGNIGVSMNLFSFSYDMILPLLEIVPFNSERQEKELPTAVKMMIQQNPKSLFCIPLKEVVPDLTNKNDIIKVKKYLEEII